MSHREVIIVGAGVAGLTAGQMVHAAERDCLLLEARNRIGGRILTHHEPGVPIAIELGPEFVHGCPPETFAAAEQAGLEVVELSGRRWCVRDRKPIPCDEMMTEDVDEIFNQMSFDQPDETFEQFLQHAHGSAEVKRWATAFVEGFNAARRQRIGTHYLLQGEEAAAKIEGHRMFRVKAGYDRLATAMATDLDISLNTEVQHIDWKPGHVQLKTTRGVLTCARCLITVPLPILEDLRFSPPIAAKQQAAKLLDMGEVIRVSFVFRQNFWEERFPKMLMLLSSDPVMPTWWTSHPVNAPVLTGWAAGQLGRNLSALPADEVRTRAVAALARVLDEHPRELDRMIASCHVHDWQSDPFTRGAYSYVRAGGMSAPGTLGEPLANTLFFAGEHTNSDGHSGTVHGALATGKRAASELINSLS